MRYSIVQILACVLCIALGIVLWPLLISRFGLLPPVVTDHVIAKERFFFLKISGAIIGLIIYVVSFAVTYAIRGKVKGTGH